MRHKKRATFASTTRVGLIQALGAEKQMVPTNILQRTFHIAHNGGIGTAFTIDVLNRQYLATAKHVVDGLQSNSKLQVMHNQAWIEIDVGQVWFPPSGSDLALISLRDQLSPPHQILVGNGEMIHLSQEIYFLGFPFGYRLDIGPLNNDYPIPFVKRGIVSSFTMPNQGAQIIFCDGHNNPGFSGGPVVAMLPNDRVQVVSVISGYRYNDEPVLLNGADTGLSYRANTGLIVSYSIKELAERAAQSQDGAIVAPRA